MVLAFSAGLAMPMMTDASHVRGGDDVPPCDSVNLNMDGKCQEKLGQACAGSKVVCNGCLARQGLKNFICTNTMDAACEGDGCIAGQTDSDKSGTSCINQSCL